MVIPGTNFGRSSLNFLRHKSGQDYEEKVSFIKSKKIAVWDVIGHCYREGSLDANIREEKVNNFSALFKAYPEIEIVLFNGGKAYETYKKWIGFGILPNLVFHKLTSSSPANTKKYEEKLREWSVIVDLLKNS